MAGMNLSLMDRCLATATVDPPLDRFHAARFWRVFMPVPNPVTPAEYLSIGRVWMYRRGPQLSYDGAVTAESSMYSGRSAALTFRTVPLANPEAVADVWTSGIANPSNQWIEVDFGVAREVDELVIVPMMYRGGARNPQTVDIQCSDDGQIWISLGRSASLDWSDGQPKRYPIGAPSKRAKRVSVFGSDET